MGTGKTSAAIARMSREKNKRFIFLTQTLREADRIADGCSSRHFAKPNNFDGAKIESLHKYLRDGRNVATTHALFFHYTDETLEYIRNGGYCLVLDEVIDIVKFVEISPDDIMSLIDSKIIEIEPDTNRVIWVRENYQGVWRNLKCEIETSCVTYEDGRLLVWMMPIEMFTSFSEALILTYMFKAQYQYYYFMLHNLDVEYIGVEKVADGFQFTADVKQHRVRLPAIHVLDDVRLNRIGDGYHSLSSTWHKNENGKTTEQIEILKRNLYNYFTNKVKCKSEDRLWASYAATEDKLGGKGYTKRHIAYNTRATNEYSNCTHLAYLVNVFPHVDTQTYFERRGFKIDRDALATSDMIQWLWRSRLRNGGEVWLYLPSKRMRNLLQKWITEVSE